MATYRRPKGSLVRAAPDWNLDRAAMAACTFKPSGTNDLTIDLFNNAVDSSSLHVWAVWIFNDAEGGFAMSPFSGHGANLVGNAQSVIFGNPQPPGQIYQDTVAPVITGDNIFPIGAPYLDYFQGGDESGDQSCIEALGPLAVVPPGYSLRVRSFVSAFFMNRGLAVTFYYLALPGPTN